MEKNRTLLGSNDLSNDDDNELKLNLSHLSQSTSPYRKAIIGYISGYIVKKLLNNISCSECTDALIGQPETCFTQLIKTKDRIGLVTPSNDVCKIVEACEKFFRAATIDENEKKKISSDKCLFNKLRNKIMSELVFEVGNLFPALDEHDKDHEVLNEDMHSF